MPKMLIWFCYICIWVEWFRLSVAPVSVWYGYNDVIIDIHGLSRVMFLMMMCSLSKGAPDLCYWEAKASGGKNVLWCSIKYNQKFRICHIMVDSNWCIVALSDLFLSYGTKTRRPMTTQQQCHSCLYLAKLSFVYRLTWNHLDSYCVLCVSS